MTPIQIAGFRAHATQASYRSKLAAMRRMVADIDPATTYVSFSAGKDSAVIAHACHAAHPGIAIMMVDPGCPTHWLEHERERWLRYAGDAGWALTLFPWEKWGHYAPAGESVCEYQSRIHKDMFDGLHAAASRAGLTTRVMGLRAAESRNRRMSVGRRGLDYTYVNGGRALLPIGTWQTADVWAYIVTAGLPWLDVYDRMGPSARNGLVGRSGEEFGREEYLRHYFPDVWRWAVSRGIFGGNLAHGSISQELDR